MKIELHILQNFAPSNLNRDDTGAPKDCELGGYRRARISSQCLKRAVRDTFTTAGMFTPEELAVRTKRLVQNVADQLAARHQRDSLESLAVVAATLGGVGLKTKPAADDYKTEYLLFLPKRQLGELADLIHRHWDTLSALSSAPQPGNSEPVEAKARSKKKEKSDKKGSFPKEIEKELSPILWAAKSSPDLALFGRMIADDPSYNVDAACQVAHAISTNRVSMDFDFYTAVDDLRPSDTAGADMMGTVEFNSSCFYRYSVLDVADLRRNLGNDAQLTQRSVKAYVRASVQAIPTGKQNSMAAHNPPSFVLAVVRKNGVPVSLTNAFTNPIRPSADSDLVDGSISALLEYLQKVSAMYGCIGVEAAFIADREVEPAGDKPSIGKRTSLDDLLSHLEKQIDVGLGA